MHATKISNARSAERTTTRFYDALLDARGARENIRLSSRRTSIDLAGESKREIFALFNRALVAFAENDKDGIVECKISLDSTYNVLTISF